jgi:hypothetical protein
MTKDIVPDRVPLRKTHREQLILSNGRAVVMLATNDPGKPTLALSGDHNGWHCHQRGLRAEQFRPGAL